MLAVALCVEFHALHPDHGKAWGIALDGLLASELWARQKAS